MVKRHRNQRKKRQTPAAELSDAIEELKIEDKPALPSDIIGVIAKFLIDDYAFGTCAALNQTCKIIEEETSPTLWKICTLPGAQAFRRLPLSARDGSSHLSFARIDALEEENIVRWRRIRDAKNAKWIQFVASPFLTPAVRSRNPAQQFKISNARLFPRMKAIFMLSDPARDEKGLSTMTVMLTENYGFGTEDVYDLSRAIDVFQKAGGREIAEVCNHDEGIVLAMQSAYYVPPKATSSAETIKPADQLPPLPYVPVVINLHGREESVSRYTSAFLESLQWLQRANTEYDGGRVLEIVIDHHEHLMSCARMFQKIAKVDPTATTLPLRFYLGTQPTVDAAIAAHHQTARALIDIFRGTYIRAYPLLPPNTLDHIWICVLVDATSSWATWEVFQSKQQKVMSVFKYDTVHKHLAQDPLPPRDALPVCRAGKHALPWL